MLHFNKSDIFSNKLKEFPLEMAFNKYNGGREYEKAIEFIRDLFLEIGHTAKKQKHGIGHRIYRLTTCMTDTTHAQEMFVHNLRIVTWLCS